MDFGWNPLGLCDVCHHERSVGLARVPGLGVSMRYGPACLAADAHPYPLVVVNTAMVGGLDNASDDWRGVVERTLAHLGVDQEKFARDVAEQTDLIARAIDTDPTSDLDAPMTIVVADPLPDEPPVSGYSSEWTSRPTWGVT